jgi:hypothetical protein
MSFWIRSELSKTKATQKADIKDFPVEAGDSDNSGGDD